MLHCQHKQWEQTVSVVISGTNSSLTSVNTNQKAEMEAKVPEVSSDLDVIAFPNPSPNNFTINVNAKTNERITMQVVDMYGRIIETRNVKCEFTYPVWRSLQSGNLFCKSYSRQTTQRNKTG